MFEVVLRDPGILTQRYAAKCEVFDPQLAR